MQDDVERIVRGPRRAHTLELSIGADTLDDLRFALRTIEEGLLRGEVSRGCSGSPSVGWTHEYRHDPEMTHERYFREVDEWLARDRSALLSSTQGE